MGLLLIVVLGVVGYAMYRTYRGDPLKPFLGPKRSALDTAEERYVRGEISKEEFEQMKNDLI